jgi:hypothetical protein
MAIGRWLIPVVIGAILWFMVVQPMAKVSNTLFGVMLTIGLVGLVGLAFKQARVPIPFLSSPLGIGIMLGIPIVFGGAFGILQGFNMGASVTPPGTGEVPSASSCYDNVNPELRGKAVSLTVNAYDVEADSSTNVDLTTNCYLYRNSISAGDYQGTTSDTTAPDAITGIFSVGDVLLIRCGGTGYYTDPYEACIDRENWGVALDSHDLVATTDLSIVGYDSSDNTLTAGSTNINDYSITMGAGETTTFRLKLKANVANKAFQFHGWAVAQFYNISSCKPISDDEGGTYTAQAVPTFLHNIDVGMDVGGQNAITEDYTPWVRSSVLMLHEWEEFKTEFELKSHSTNDPNGGENSTAFDGVAIVAFDSTWTISDDNVASYGYYTPDSSQDNVGVTETLTSPLGKDNGVLIITA